jgi:hypothetical protein
MCHCPHLSQYTLRHDTANELISFISLLRNCLLKGLKNDYRILGTYIACNFMKVRLKEPIKQQYICVLKGVG